MSVNTLHKAACRLEANTRNTYLVCRTVFYPFYRFAGNGGKEVTQTLDIHSTATCQKIGNDVWKLYLYGLCITRLE